MKIPYEKNKPIEFTVPTLGEGSFYVLEEKNQEFYPFFHRHKEYQITYIIKGKGALILGGLMLPFSEDQIFLIKPEDPHVFIREEGPDNIHAVHIFFAEEMLNFLTKILEFRFLNKLITELSSSKKMDENFSKEIFHLFKNIKETSGFKCFFMALKILRFLCNHTEKLVSLYTGLPKLSFQESSGMRINKVLNYTLQHFDQDITIAKVATIIHMSPTTFSKYFKKHTMKSYINFLNEVRIERACQLLASGEFDTISNTAFLCGFNNVVHFNRIFKGILKVSPSAYLNKNRVSLK